jgi:plastocyanin
MLKSMKRTLALVTVSLVFAHSLSAGDIVGTVRARGKEGADQEASGGKYDSRKFKFVERVDYDQLKEFVVSIDSPVEFKAETPKTVEVVTQKDATFSPHVLPILVGTTVRWPNNDTIYHNVFSYSEAAAFDLGLYKDDKADAKKVPFPKVGRVDAFCSIHSQMHCVILVMENPFYALTDAKGKFTITNVPPGKYKLKAWHERMPSESKEVVVPEKGSVKIDFELGIKNLPKY